MIDTEKWKLFSTQKFRFQVKTCDSCILPYLQTYISFHRSCSLFSCWVIKLQVWIRIMLLVIVVVIFSLAQSLIVFMYCWYIYSLYNTVLWSKHNALIPPYVLICMTLPSSTNTLVQKLVDWLSVIFLCCKLFAKGYLLFAKRFCCFPYDTLHVAFPWYIILCILSHLILSCHISNFLYYKPVWSTHNIYLKSTVSKDFIQLSAKTVVSIGVTCV